jgi:hypothetical protein
MKDEAPYRNETPREIITRWGQVYRWDGGDAHAEAQEEADALLKLLSESGYVIAQTPIPTPGNPVTREEAVSDFPSQTMTETFELDHMLSCLRDRADDKLCLDAVSEIVSLKARIAELEANERSYEEIIGKKTYREVAERIRELETTLREVAAVSPIPVTLAKRALQPKEPK